MQQGNTDKVNGQIFKDMQNLIKDMEQVDLHLNLQLIPEKVILLLGETKAGKTTLMYYLLGKKLIREYNKQLGFYQMKPEAKIFDALIGNSYESTTVYPNIPTELGEDKVLIIDMPGFSDTRSAYRLLNIYIIREVIKKIKSVHVSVVIPNTHLAASELVSIIEKNCLLLNHKLLATPGCLSFILTKIEDKEGEQQVFHESLKETLSDLNSQQFGKIENIVKAKTYIFENSQPQVKAGLGLKMKIIAQNKFFEIDEKPQNLLSYSYAQVISGQQNQQQFQSFLMNLLNGMNQKLKSLIEMFAFMVEFHHLEDLQSISIVEQDKEQELKESIQSLAKAIAVGGLADLKLDLNEFHAQTNKQDKLFNLCRKYYSPNRQSQKYRSLIESFADFVNWSGILQSEQSKICLQLRKKVHKLFKFFSDSIHTIKHIKNQVIAGKVQQILNSQQIREGIESYKRFAIENNLISRIANQQGCQQLSQRQDFKQILYAFNPNFVFQEGEEVIENIKVSVLGQIKHKKMNIALMQTVRLLDKPTGSQANESGIIAIHEISKDNIQIIKNMPIGTIYLRSLMNAFTSLKKQIEGSSKQFRVQFGIVLLRKIGQIFQKLHMYEQACLFYLSIPSQLQAQVLINTAITFKQFHPDFVRQILLPYYSKININFQMVQKLFNYLSLHIYDYPQIIQNQILRIKTLEDMWNFDTTKLALIKRFEFDLISSIEQNKKSVLAQAKANEQLITKSNFMNLQRQIMNLKYL